MIVTGCELGLGMGKAAAVGVVWPHTPWLGQIWSNRPLICVLMCFGCAVRRLLSAKSSRDRNRETAKMLLARVRAYFRLW